MCSIEIAFNFRNCSLHLQVLLWLKQWDCCVFGSQIRATADDVLTALHRHSSITQHENFSEKKGYNRNRRVPFVKESHKHSNVMDREDVNSKGISNVWNRKSTTNQPPEQKVYYEQCLFVHIFNVPVCYLL